jgi:methylated-DNA-[protein]-cysteine S-methyltransferase
MRHDEADPHHHLILDSPVGELTLIASATGLRAVLWPHDDTSRVKVPHSEPSDDHQILNQAAEELDRYFNGGHRQFAIALDLRGTEFQQAVWLSLANIPYGQTVSYAEQAKRLGRPRAVRAVGSANARNPISIVLPCHRVVGSDGSLTGFAGGLDTKRQLLQLEGALPTPS